jgi:hypothetical protein
LSKLESVTNTARLGVGGYTAQHHAESRQLIKMPSNDACCECSEVLKLLNLLARAA